VNGISIHNLESGQKIEYWRALHEEYFPDWQPPNSIRGIRKRIQRYMASESSRNPEDHLYVLSQKIEARTVDLAKIPTEDLFAAKRLEVMVEVTNFKSYDERARAIQQNLENQNAVQDFPNTGVIFHNDQK
jgi:hypothetical protein